MTKTFPIYIIAGAVALGALICGLAGFKILFITNARIAAITVAAAGFVMCSTGLLAPFVSTAPAHPLTIAGYLLGALALFAGIVQLFNLHVPLLADPKTALWVMATVIVLKVTIAQFSFLIKA
jgi:hypothetical protein